MTALPGPALMISLDFELYWGVHDHITLAGYKENLLGARQAAPAILKLFERYKIHATWATVGFLFCRDRQDLLSSIPELKPHYNDSRLSPYESLTQVGADESEDPFHYAPSLIAMINGTPFQEIGTHTLSHYCCLEPEQNVAAFGSDLEAARKLASKWKLELKSIVFPRNQYDDRHLGVCRDAGMTAYRGNERSWIYEGRTRREENAIRRLLRLVDAYLNLTGHHTFSISPDPLCNFPSSRFLRPYCSRLQWLEGMRLKRILNALNFAAGSAQVYHLWWHPHNFGRHLPQNLAFLEEILQHFSKLRESHGMESLNMRELAARVHLPTPMGASA